jgi:hypothetical protein
LSGGHFDYKQYVLSDIADKIELKIETGEFPQEIKDIMQNTVNSLNDLYPIITAIDYLICGDYGDKSFLDKISSLQQRQASH